MPRNPGIFRRRTGSYLLGAVIVASSVFAVAPRHAGANASDAASGPLVVSPVNPRYFSVGSGDHEKPVYLTGSNLWNNLQDGPGFGTCDQPGPAFDWTAYLDFLQSRRMNFIRGWRWEHFKFKLRPDLDIGGPYCVAPQPWERTGPGTAYDGGPRFDLDRFDQAYFDRLRARIIEAGDQNIYVSVMLFEGFCLHVCDDDTITAGHPFDGQNNTNGIDIDAIEDYQSASVPASVLALQRAYLRKVIDTVQDLGNVLYEVANESWTGSVSWQYDVIDYVKRYETDMGYDKHPVGMSAIWPGGHDSDLYASPADWIMPGIFAPRFGENSDYRNDPPAATGAKVIISDDDHYSPCDVDALWAWRSLVRGVYPSQLDCGIGDPAHPNPDFDYLEPARLAQGDARRQADRMDLLATQPRGDLTSTGYALANPGREYLVLQPEDSAALTVTLLPGAYKVRWFHIDDRIWQTAPKVTVATATTTTFTSPFATPGPATLYLKRKP